MITVDMHGQLMAILWFMIKDWKWQLSVMLYASLQPLSNCRHWKNMQRFKYNQFEHNQGKGFTKKEVREYIQESDYSAEHAI